MNRIIFHRENWALLRMKKKKLEKFRVSFPKHFRTNISSPVIISIIQVHLKYNNNEKKTQPQTTAAKQTIKNILILFHHLEN